MWLFFLCRTVLRKYVFTEWLPPESVHHLCLIYSNCPTFCLPYCFIQRIIHPSWSILPWMAQLSSPNEIDSQSSNLQKVVVKGLTEAVLECPHRRSTGLGAENRKGAWCEAGVDLRVRAPGHSQEEDWLESWGWRWIWMGSVHGRSYLGTLWGAKKAPDVLLDDSTKFSKLSQVGLQMVEGCEDHCGADSFREQTSQTAHAAVTIIQGVSDLTQITCWPHSQKKWFLIGLHQPLLAPVHISETSPSTHSPSCQLVQHNILPPPHCKPTPYPVYVLLSLPPPAPQQMRKEEDSAYDACVGNANYTQV